MKDISGSGGIHNPDPEAFYPENFFVDQGQGSLVPQGDAQESRGMPPELLEGLFRI
jgi:hypothetical protein